MDEQTPDTTILPKETKPIEKSEKKWLLIGIIMVLVLLFLGIVYTTLTSKPKESVSETTKTATQSAKETPNPTPVEIKDETADWQILTSTKSGFSIKYPQNWLNRVCDSEEVSFLAPTKGTLGICQSEFGGMINIGYTPDFKYEDYIIQQPFVELDSLNNAKREETTVAGKKAIKISGTYKEDSFTLKKDAQKILYLVDHDGGVLTLSYYCEPAWGDYSKTFEQIVATLKFLP